MAFCLREEVAISKIDGRKIPDSVREQVRFNAIREWPHGMPWHNLAQKYGSFRKIIRERID